MDTKFLLFIVILALGFYLLSNQQTGRAVTYNPYEDRTFDVPLSSFDQEQYRDEPTVQKQQDPCNYLEYPGYAKVRGMLEETKAFNSKFMNEVKTGEHIESCRNNPAVKELVTAMRDAFVIGGVPS